MKKKKRGLEEEKREKVFCVPLSLFSRVKLLSSSNPDVIVAKEKKKKKKDVVDQDAFLKDSWPSMIILSVRPTVKVVFYVL